MTETEWFADTTSLALMTHHLFGGGEGRRRARLFACACCRRVWHLIDVAARRIVEIAEALADGQATEAELQTAANPDDFDNLEARFYGVIGPQLSKHEYQVTVAAMALAEPRLDILSAGAIARDTAVCPSQDFYWSPRMGRKAITEYAEGDLSMVRRLIHEVFGNPFRPVAFNAAWRVPLVTSLAQATYDVRSLPSGEFDSDRLAVISDALEEAGCSNSGLLSHLRSPGPHIRGCWAVDIILGNE